MHDTKVELSKASNEIVLWRTNNPDIGMFEIDKGQKPRSAVCGFDQGVEIVCQHYEGLAKYGDDKKRIEIARDKASKRQ